MIFVDSSAIYALADASDDSHELAKSILAAALESGEELLTHNYVLLESTALIQRRLGLNIAMAIYEHGLPTTVYWVNESDHQEAVDMLGQRGRRGLSLVDCMSFIVMRKLEVRQAFAFDADFEREGFEMYSPRLA